MRPEIGDPRRQVSNESETKIAFARAAASSRWDTAVYVAELAGELAAAARAADLNLSAYLLDMACLEARRAVGEDVAGWTTHPPGGAP